MKKNIALMALTGILTLASCGGDTPSTDVCATANACTINVTVSGLDAADASKGTVTVKDSKGNQVYQGAASKVAVSSTGDYTVAAADVPGYTAPAAKTVTVSAAGNVDVALAYTKANTNNGAIKITSPVEGATLSAGKVDVKFTVDPVAVVKDIKCVVDGTTVNATVDASNNGTCTVTVGANTKEINVTGTDKDGKTALATVHFTVNAAVKEGDIALEPKDTTKGDNIVTIEQDINGTKSTITYTKGNIVVKPNPIAGSDRMEVFFGATTGDTNAANRVYDGLVNPTTPIIIDTSTIPQGEQKYVIARYWTKGSNTTRSTMIVPDNLGPQVPDVIPTSKLGQVLTQQKGNWVNGLAELSFKNIATLVDNPTGTAYAASGVQKIEWRAVLFGKPVQMDGSLLLGTELYNPYKSKVDTTKVPDGRYEVFAVAYDQLGNMSDITAVNRFVLGIDNTGPVVTPGEIDLMDTSVGGVVDDFNNGGAGLPDASAPGGVRGKNNYTIDDKCNFYGSGATDLYLPSDSKKYLSGIAHVVKRNDGKIEDAGVGLGAPVPPSITVNGLDVTNRFFNKAIGTVTCQFFDVNGMDANNFEIAFSFNDAKDLLGNPAKGVTSAFKYMVDNQRPTQVRFLTKADNVDANGQTTLQVAASDDISGIRSGDAVAPYMVFGRDTGGAAFAGRAVQLSANNSTNFRFFRPTNAALKLDLFAVAVDNAGNVASERNDIKVNDKGARVVGPLAQANMLAQKRDANGQYPAGVTGDENPLAGALDSTYRFEILNGNRPGAVSFAQTDVKAAALYREVDITNVLNRIGKGTNDAGGQDDLNAPTPPTQPFAPLFLVAYNDSAPYVNVDSLKKGNNAYHGVIIDKNGWVSEVVRNQTNK